MYVDASQVGLGCVLFQHEKVIVRALRKHQVHERKYPTYDLKLAGMVFAFKI